MIQTTLDPKPMPLPDFISALVKLVKRGQWKMFKEAVAKRKQYFESQGLMDKF